MYISSFVVVNTFIGGRQPQNKLMRLRTYKKNWYSIYVRSSSNFAAELMKSLQGTYERVPGVYGRKGRCRVPRERNCIQWTPKMGSACVQLKEALGAECELYIPSPDG